MIAIDTKTGRTIRLWGVDLEWMGLGVCEAFPFYGYIEYTFNDWKQLKLREIQYDL